jgi:proteasome lid subunit RPN8/RPN11
MITSIIIEQSVMQTILEYCIQKKPHEACGFLLGTDNRADVHVNEFAPVPNIADKPLTRFMMEPASMASVLLNSTKAGRSIVGTLHSHPTAQAIPSELDLLTQWHTLPAHCIVSLLKDSDYDIRAYSYQRTSDTSRETGSSTKPYIPLSITIADESTDKS